MAGLRHLLEAAVAVVFVLLVWNNYTLRRQQTLAAAAARSARGFVPNDVLPAFPIVDMAGRRGSLDLAKSRATVLIVDPRCDSCREIISRLEPGHAVRIVSVAPLNETRTMANEMKVAPLTYAVGEALATDLAARFRINPQVLLVDHGRVVRTCASLAECR